MTASEGLGAVCLDEDPIQSSLGCFGGLRPETAKKVRREIG